MAAAPDLRDELNCSICLNIFSDPVLLSCGHNFCRVCIGDVLDTQGRSGAYSCPECRAEFRERPALQRNMKLCNIAEHFLTPEPDGEDGGVYCTYCLYAPVPAAKTCLHCEASLCQTHLRAHTTSGQHTLTEPTARLEDRKCPVHKRLLEYYCCEDAACVCVSCQLDGPHRGHHVDTLSRASEKKKERLTRVLEELTSKRQEAEKEVQSLQERRKRTHDKATEMTEQVRTLFRDIRAKLEFLEKRVLLEVSWQSVQASLKVSDLIRQLEIQRDEMSKKMSRVEELRAVADPLTFLRGPDAEVEPGRRDSQESDVKDLDEGQIAVTLHSGLGDILVNAKMKRGDPGGGPIPCRNVETMCLCGLT